jgi:hypothetical protein
MLGNPKRNEGHGTRRERSSQKEIDFWRQLELFDPSRFTRPVVVIGGGATGSYITFLLAKMGCRDITVYDPDVVENYNLPNQVYGPKHTGEKKVIALSKVLSELTGVEIKSVDRLFHREEVRGIVFVLTDTMSSRKEIWESSIKYQINVDLMIETRMGAEGGRIYAINPSSPSQIERYEKTLYSDEEAEESPCSRRAIAPTVATIAGMAVFTMLNFVNRRPFPNEVILSLSPFLCLNKFF